MKQKHYEHKSFPRAFVDAVVEANEKRMFHERGAVTPNGQRMLAWANLRAGTTYKNDVVIWRILSHDNPAELIREDQRQEAAA